jgi:hypothetical protein
MKSILSNSAFLGVNRCIGFMAVTVLAVLPAVGAGSAKQADLAALQKMNPELAKDLAEVMKTGKEEDKVYGLATKISQ